jgi:pimeloyl-ACP methyl ester carboxylesterase
MVVALAGPLSEHRRVIAVDRPGHGWSDRPGGRADASPARQADLVAEALGELGVERVVVVGHSLAGAAATSLALNHGECVAGLVLLSAVTHPWPGGIAWYYRLAATPILGRLFVDTIMTPVGAWGLETAAAGSFSPSAGPADYADATSAALVLRPDEFRWNGQDVAALKAFVTAQAPRYHEIDVPCAIIASAEDTVVSTDIHSRSIARKSRARGSRCSRAWATRSTTLPAPPSSSRSTAWQRRRRSGPARLDRRSYLVVDGEAVEAVRPALRRHARARRHAHDEDVAPRRRSSGDDDCTLRRSKEAQELAAHGHARLPLHGTRGGRHRSLSFPRSQARRSSPWPETSFISSRFRIGFNGII